MDLIHWKRKDVLTPENQLLVIIPIPHIEPGKGRIQWPRVSWPLETGLP